MLCFEAANCHCCRLGRGMGKSKGGICKIGKDQETKVWAPTLKTHGKSDGITYVRWQMRIILVLCPLRKEYMGKTRRGDGNKMGEGKSATLMLCQIYFHRFWVADYLELALDKMSIIWILLLEVPTLISFN